MTSDLLEFTLTSAIAFFIAAGSPGPATLAVAATSMAHGRRSGICLGAGLSVGLAFWGTLVALGLGTIIAHWAPALVALRIIGGLLLLYLAWKAARSALSHAATAAHAERSASAPRLFVRGILLNVFNPKALLAWIAVIAVGVPPSVSAIELFAVTGLCAVLGCLIYWGYAAIFSFDRIMQGYRRARRGIDAALALLFGVAGLRLIFARTDAG